MQLNLSQLAIEVLEKRYLARNYRGEILETPEDMFRRVARAIAEADRLFEAKSNISRTADEFEKAMLSLSFLPNSPCLMHAGRPLGQLAACFVLPVEDNLESIFQSLKDAALIHQTGGGTGFSFSSLRPKGDAILPASGVAGGPASFIKLFDTATYLIDRNRMRPGANMGVLHVSHPDIEEFIQLKAGEAGCLKNFNISVAVDDLFLEQVKKDGMYPLIHPRTGVEVGKRSAMELLDQIATCAWKTGDPGVLFFDRINRDNPTPGMGKLKATNPCGEQPLLPYESCTLGSINLTRMIDGDQIDLTKLEKTVKLAVHFLDNVIEINRYPLRQVEEWSRANRKIGLGVMGFADMLILMGIPYQSPKALDLAERVMKQIQKTTREASADLAEKRSNFPSFDHSIFPATGVRKRRNATLTTVAPTGTISIIAGVSSGIEPVYAFEFKRRFSEKVYDQVHPLYEAYLQKKLAVPENCFQTAMDIDPEWHMKVQAVFQKYTDNAVSKTVNVPQSATVQDIKNLFLKAFEMDVKGITVYRDQSLENQILAACSMKNEECS